jgi:aspartate beta-hydroxylase
MNLKLKDFTYDLLDQIAIKFPNEDLTRLRTNMDCLLQGPNNPIKSQHSMQNPGFHYYSGLTDKAWWDGDIISKEKFLLHRKNICNELEGIKNLFSPYSLSPTEDYTPSYLDGTMTVYRIIDDFHTDQELIKSRQALVPKTMEFLNSIPSLSDTVLFSCLAPGTHLKAHESEDNVRLSLHMGLIIPSGSGITVANETRVWPEDELLCFDPSFTHGAWNDGKINRYVLIFTIWHPDLSDAEIFFIKNFSKNYYIYSK